MLEFKNDPKKLMMELDRFLSIYYGDRQVEYKPNLNEIAVQKIPQPLKDLYSFVGKYPGKHGTLHTQDTLFFYPGIFKEKLCIVGENQGVWSCGTEVEGDDPPVYLINWTTEKKNDANWEYVCGSLSEFLVSFCLREAFFASTYRSVFKGRIENTVSNIRKQDYEVILLWQGKYSQIKDYVVPQIDSFYLIEDSILLWDMWNSCWWGTNYKNADRAMNLIQSELNSDRI